MAKKAPDPQALALQSLSAALADPGPKVLLGSAKVPGFFQGGTAPIKAAAKLCETQQWLIPIDDWHGKGASRKQKYRLSPAGVQAALQHSEPLDLLRGLSASVRDQVAAVQAMHDQLGGLARSLQPLSAAVTALTQRLQPPNLDALLQNLKSTATPSAPTPASTDWLDEVPKLVAEQRQRDRYQPLTLPQVYAALRQARPALTLGQFHDGLRQLRDQQRLRLAPYTRALATIDDPKAALFLDGEVMYYAELP